MKSAASPSRGLDASYNSPRARGRVLVVDDTMTRRDAVVLALEAQGFEILKAASAKAAFDVAKQQAPDAILLDLALPEAQTFAVCRQLKAACPTFLPVLYLSSRTSREARARALDAGVDAYLTRPVDSDELCAAAGALIRRKREEATRVAAAALGSLLDDALDALADHVALLGADGELVAVNRSW
ncbi:MAG TPA: response regulator transcription factor, partial [Gemmatimonadaceae bacterium]|nr:response regulator transcription factor [Gemmatimonadaceae bacterium]